MDAVHPEETGRGQVKPVLPSAPSVAGGVSRARDGVIEWLLRGDPAIRWQTLRDLVGSGASAIERERRRVAREGWGARLLARRDARGAWAAGLSSDDGLYSPKWISTTYTMLALRDIGLPPRSR